MKRFWLLIVLLVCLSPLGLLAEGAAWGEWGVNEVKDQLGTVPAGLMAAEGRWVALLPDYSVPGWGENQARSGYFLAALVGSSLTYGAVWVMSRFLLSRR